MMEMNGWTAIETAAQLGADFSNGRVVRVADALKTLDKPEGLAVALFLGEYLSPAKRALLVNLVLEKRPDVEK